jgi:hypothetical protein
MEMVGEIDSVMIVMFIRSYTIQCLTRRYLKGKQPRRRRKSPPLKRHLKLEIKMLQNAPRDADKLRQLLKVKQRQNQEAMHREDIEGLITEIEMLKVVLQHFCLLSQVSQVLHIQTSYPD